jgi:DNA-binding FrmR family transcriptional regulator
MMKTAIQRLNNINGQIEGVKKMMAEKSDCLEVLTQLKAIKAAISGVMDSVVENQLDNCMQTLNKKDKNLLIKLKNYVKSN